MSHLKHAVSGTLLIVAVAACVQPDAGDGAIPSSICVAHLQFPGDSDRTEFLRLNADSLVRGGRAQELFLLTEPNDATQGNNSTLKLYTQRHCDGLDLNDAYELQGADARVDNTIEIPANRAIEEITRGLAIRPHNIERACAVRFSATSTEIAEIAALLPYVGLRSAQVEGADNMAYVAADEDCSLLVHFVRAATQQVRGRVATDAVQCPRSSLQECGYPNEIEVVRSP